MQSYDKKLKIANILTSQHNFLWLILVKTRVKIKTRVKTIKKYAICLAVTVLATAGCITDSDYTRSLGPGDMLPEFTVVTSDGDTVTTASLAGTVSVITFFNTSCRDCQRELPKLQQAMMEHPDVRFLCIAREESAESIAAYWADHSFTLPYSPQSGRQVYSLFASSIIPRIYVVSPDLVITAAYAPEE